MKRQNQYFDAGLASCERMAETIKKLEKENLEYAQRNDELNWEVQRLTKSLEYNERRRATLFRSVNNHRTVIKSMRGQVDRVVARLKSQTQIIYELENQ